MLALTLGSQLNRNSLICDLNQRRIHKKVLQKGSFELNLIRNIPIERNVLETPENMLKYIVLHGEFHGELIFRLLDCTGW